MACDFESHAIAKKTTFRRAVTTRAVFSFNDRPEKSSWA